MKLTFEKYLRKPSLDTKFVIINVPQDVFTILTHLHNNMLNCLESLTK